MSRQNSPTLLSKLERLHPYEMLVFLGMVGSGLIFIFMAAAYLFTGLHQLEGPGRHLPLAFLMSTLLLAVSGFSVGKMKTYYREERISQLEGALRNTVLLGLAFTILQLAGWKELNEMGVTFTGLPSGSFLFVLSGIHIFHLIGAMIFGLILLLQLRKTQEDGVKQLILVTNPFEKMRIRLFAIYWHFMDLIWLVLFLLFILSF